MKKRTLLMVLALGLSLMLAVSGTLAYLTDTDEAVNVMTLGNVSIEQYENGDKGFKQEQPLYPAYYEDDNIDWDSAEGIITKTVTVENKGTSDAYVRTWFAFEAGGMSFADFQKYILLDVNKTDWTWAWDSTKTYTLKNQHSEESNYYIAVATLNKPLIAATTTPYSLFQFAMSKEAGNDVVSAMGDYYTVLVLSQAMQTVNFEGMKPADALAIGFTDVKVENGAIGKNHPWKDGFEQDYPEIADTWDGTVDTTWYNDTDTEFELTTAEQLAGLAELVDGGNTFAGKTVTLSTDVDLYAVDADGNRINFNPIGHSSNGKSFNGTFDGQGKTISNLYMQSNLDSNNGGWLYEGEYYGLFAYTNGATIKNVTVEDAYISSGRNEAAGVVGNAVDTTFADISIKDATLIAYNNSAGGVAAECYGDCSFTNISVDEDTVIGPLWGTYDVRLGGVVGMMKSSDKASFSNVTVSCQLDAINDVAANYQYWLYRYSGMLIGHVDGVNGVADPTGYVTCENVTVTYGDWVNYHYCEFESLGAGSYNGPGEYKYARVEAGTGTNGIDLSTCNHDEDESHNVPIVFDQLFGGGQGVKGLKTYDGVTVNYPNE